MDVLCHSVSFDITQKRKNVVKQDLSSKDTEFFKMPRNSAAERREISGAGLFSSRLRTELSSSFTIRLQRISAGKRRY